VSSCEINRVIGLPGEELQIRRGEIYINDKLISGIKEIRRDLFTNLEPITIPNDCFSLICDDMKLSRGSLYLSMIHTEKILSRALFVYWPLKHAKYLL
jgi:signal peptidase I